jgi:hypothetical protein
MIITNLSFLLDQYESAVVEFMREVKRGSEQLDPILSQIERIRVSHGGTTRQVSEPTVLDTQMKLATVDATIQLDWYRQTDVDAFAGFLWDFCERFKSLEKKHLFETLSKTTEAVGNVVDGKGMNIWDAQIEMLKKTEMRFDEEGRHGNTMVMGPDLAKKMQENPPTPEQVQRWNETMQAKKNQYYAKKRTRRLS